MDDLLFALRGVVAGGEPGLLVHAGGEVGERARHASLVGQASAVGMEPQYIVEQGVRAAER